MQFHTRQRRLSILIIWSEVFLSVDRNGFKVFIDWRWICLFSVCRCSALTSQSRTTPGGKWPTPTGRRRRRETNTPAGCTETGRLHRSAPLLWRFHCQKFCKLFSAFQELNCSGMCCRDPGLNSDLQPFAAFLFEFSQMYFSVIPNVNWRTPVCFSRCRLIYFGGYGCKTMGEVQNTSSTSFIVEEMSWVNNNEETF